MRSLAFIQLGSYGAALESVNALAKYPSLKCLEILPFGTYSQIFIEGDSEEINSYRKFLRTADLQKSVVFPYDERILKAFYHLENSEVGSHLVVLESNFVGNIFSAVFHAFEIGYKVVDFTMPRFPNSSAALILTASGIEPHHQCLKKIEEQKVKVTVIEDIKAPLKKYFN